MLSLTIAASLRWTTRAGPRFDAQLNLVEEALKEGFDWPFCQTVRVWRLDLPVLRARDGRALHVRTRASRQGLSTLQTRA
jgi:hypothetical protein